MKGLLIAVVALVVVSAAWADDGWTSYAGPENGPVAVLPDPPVPLDVPQGSDDSGVGATGETGPQGPPGPQGPAGPQGPKGDSADLCQNLLGVQTTPGVKIWPQRYWGFKPRREQRYLAVNGKGQLVCVTLSWINRHHALIAKGFKTRARQLSAVSVDRPRCAIKNPDPPKLLGSGPRAYLWGEFLNRCLDPVLEMGSFACLVEVEYPESTEERLISCYATRDRPVLYAPHETNLFASAHCDYTTVKRYYHMEGYGWAVDLKGKKYGGPQITQQSTDTFGLVGVGLKSQRYCHIRPDAVKWSKKRRAK